MNRASKTGQGLRIGALLIALLTPLMLWSTSYAEEAESATSLSFVYQGNNGWWSRSQYDANRITGRTVAGDFNGDGIDDQAALYDYGGNVAVWHVWLGTGSSFTYQGNDGWWSRSQYDANRITSRVVAGDFNRDGFTDIAAMYDYGSNNSTWHVWLSTGDAFEYQGNGGWWSATQYGAGRTTARVVAADFDGDGDADIAAMYDYLGNNVTWHVWLSTGSALAYQGNAGWWSRAQYAPDRVTGRVVAGDFDGDQIGDIATMYDYGSNNSTWHVWLSTGGAFAYQGNNGWWSGSQYDANRTTSRVVAEDFDADGDTDIAAMYDYGGNNVTWHVWLSTRNALAYQGNNGWWSGSQYAPDRVTGRVVAGDFDGDEIGDIAAMYDYSSNNSTWHVWLSDAPNRVYLSLLSR